MIQIVTQENSNRFLYVLNVLLSTIGDQEYRIVHEEKVDFNFPVIAYSDTSPDYTCIHIQPHSLLNAAIDEGVIENDFFLWNNIPCFLKTNGTVPFDVFTASFWLLSRWEEYLSNTKDEHQRFTANSSFAFKCGFLDRPVIDEWVVMLFDEINIYWPNSIVDKRTFKHTLTVDIDAPFAYQHKSIVTHTGASIKHILSGKLSLIKDRINVLKRATLDPFDTYNLFKKYSSSSSIIYFIHVGDKTTHDPATPKPSVMIDLLYDLSKYAAIGLHPSYKSHKNNEFEIEKNRLENWIKQPVTKSRFHFFKFEIPISIQHISKAGINEEYSMGYPEEIGFRAGTSFPFPFYDLKQEKELSVVIYPFAFMDATYMHYKRDTVNDSLNSMKEIIDKVYSINGCLISVWHNHSFSVSEGNPEWIKVLTEVMAYIHSK